VRDLDPTRYASMNLVWGDASGVSIAYARQEGALDIEPLPRGVHVLCNDRLGAPGFPRGRRLSAAIAAAIHVGWPALIEPIHTALGDHTRVPLDEVTPSHLPLELGRELTATCIHSPYYGTRSSTLFAAAPGRVIAYLHADGPPCTTPFSDRRALLEPSA
jgi:uncharacterized protein with NRDE domain